MAEQHFTTRIQELLGLSNLGDAKAREGLFQLSLGRLRNLARGMFRTYPRLMALEETDDILNKAVLRLYSSLDEVQPPTVRAFFGYAALHMRRVLVDLARYYAARKLSYLSNSPRVAPEQDPARLIEWSEFHLAIDHLNDQEQELFHLLFYQGLAVAEVAEMLNRSERTVRRQWREARIRLGERLQGEFPEMGLEAPLVSTPEEK